MYQAMTFDETSPAIRHLKSRDRRLALVIGAVGPLACTRPNLTPFEFLAFHIVGQMLSTKAADAIYGRLADLVHGCLTAQDVAALDEERLRAIGLSRPKAGYMLGLAHSVLAGAVDFPALEDMDDEGVIRTLTRLRGIGNWTAKMYAIFMLGRPDILPLEDGAFLNGCRWLYGTAGSTPEALRRRGKRWSPWASVAARYLYRARDTGLTKIPFAESLGCGARAAG